MSSTAKKVALPPLVERYLSYLSGGAFLALSLVSKEFYRAYQSLHHGAKHSTMERCTETSELAMWAIATQGCHAGTLLCAAAMHRHICTIRGMIRAGVHVEARNSRGYTPLIVAAQRGYSDVVTCLLDAGAYVDSRDRAGFTALMRAAGNKHMEVLECLLDRGANIKACTGPQEGQEQETANVGHQGTFTCSTY
jgi:hypothetical protein